MSKKDLIVTTWRRLGRAPVGQRELREIQKVISRQLGESAVPGPASIARILADEGAELRHPEVIECDVRWRESLIQKDAGGDLDSLVPHKRLRLENAEAFINKLEKLRRDSERAEDQRTLRSLRETAIDAKQTAQSLAKKQTLEETERAEQAEIAQWLAVWIQTPNLFDEWLDLRHRSPEFRKKFLTEKSS